MKVHIHNTVSFSKAIHLLKNKLKKDGVFTTLKDREAGVNTRGRKRIKEGRAKTRLKKMLKTQARNRQYAQ